MILTDRLTTVLGMVAAISTALISSDVAPKQNGIILAISLGLLGFLTNKKTLISNNQIKR
jgi:hypothetical protein